MLAVHQTSFIRSTRLPRLAWTRVRAGSYYSIKLRDRLLAAAEGCRAPKCVSFDIAAPRRIQRSGPTSIRNPGKGVHYPSVNKSRRGDRLRHPGQGRQTTVRDREFAGRSGRGLVRGYVTFRRPILDRSRASSPTRGGSIIVALWDVTNRVPLCAPSNLIGRVISRGKGRVRRDLRKHGCRCSWSRAAIAIESRQTTACSRTLSD